MLDKLQLHLTNAWVDEMYTGKWFDIIHRGIDYALFILIGRQTSVLLFPLDWIVHLVS